MSGLTRWWARNSSPTNSQASDTTQSTETSSTPAYLDSYVGGCDRVDVMIDGESTQVEPRPVNEIVSPEIEAEIATLGRLTSSYGLYSPESHLRWLEIRSSVTSGMEIEADIFDLVNKLDVADSELTEAFSVMHIYGASTRASAERAIAACEQLRDLKQPLADRQLTADLGGIEAVAGRLKELNSAKAAALNAQALLRFDALAANSLLQVCAADAVGSDPRQATRLAVGRVLLEAEQTSQRIDAATLPYLLKDIARDESNRRLCIEWLAAGAPELLPAVQLKDPPISARYLQSFEQPGVDVEVLGGSVNVTIEHAAVTRQRGKVVVELQREVSGADTPYQPLIHEALLDAAIGWEEGAEVPYEEMARLMVRLVLDSSNAFTSDDAEQLSEKVAHFDEYVASGDLTTDLAEMDALRMRYQSPDITRLIDSLGGAERAQQVVEGGLASMKTESVLQGQARLVAARSTPSLARKLSQCDGPTLEAVAEALLKAEALGYVETHLFASSVKRATREIAVDPAPARELGALEP